MGFLISTENKKHIIRAFFADIYKEAFYNSENQEDFKNYIEKELQKDYNKNYNDYKNSNDELKKYYDSQLESNIEQFKKDKALQNSVDDLKRDKSEADEVKKMKNIIDTNIEEAKLKNTLEEFEKYFKELKELEDYRNKYLDSFNNYITLKIPIFLSFQELEKNTMKKFIDKKFEEAKTKKDKDEFKKYYDFEELEEFRKNHSKAFENYIAKKFPEYQNSQNSEDKNKLEKDFKLYFEEIEEFDKYKKKYSEDYNSYIDSKLLLFESYQESEKKKMKELIDKEYEKAKEKKGEEEFKKYYDELNELNNYRNKYSGDYNSYILVKINEFNTYKKIEQMKEKEIILNKLTSFYIVAKQFESEKEFEEYYNGKPELKKLKEKYPEYYDNNYRVKLESFKTLLKEREKDNKTQKKEIDKFFTNNFSKIFDLNENELNKNIQSNIDSDDKIKNKIKENQSYYDNKLKEFKKKHIEEAITNEIKINYPNILKISSDENNFKINMDNKLRENENIKKYLDLENEDYKNILKKYCLENSDKISKDFEDKNMKQKNSVNDFFDENYEGLLDLYKNSEESELENKLDAFLIQKGKQDIKKYPNFEIIKNKNFKIFQTEKEFNRNTKKNELIQFFDTNYKPILLDSCKNEIEFSRKIDELLESQNKNDMKYLPEFNKVLRDNLDLFNKDKEILKNEVIDFFNNNCENIVDQCENEENFKQKIEQLLNEQNKQKLKKSLNYETILREKTELFKKEKNFKNKEKEIINKFLSNFTQENYEDKNTIENFTRFLNPEIANSICTHIFRSGNFDIKIENKIMNYANELINDDTVKVRHLNIIVCGNSGAGKSTLINNILQLEGENRQKTGIGVHQTEKTEYIESQNIPFIRCADSRGTEIGKYNINKVKKDIENFIDQQKSTNDPDKYIHCIWYCADVTSDRFHDEEKYFLRDLQSVYSMKTLPVIIVGTKDYFEDTEEFQNDLRDREIFYPFVPVLSEKKKQGMGFIQPHGLNELKRETFEKAGNAIESACFNGIIHKIITKFFEKIEQLKNSIKENILQNIRVDINFDNLKNEMKQILIFIINKYSSINLCNVENQNEINFDFNSDERINGFINDCYNYFFNKYETGYEQKIYSESEKLSMQINNAKLKFNQENNTNFKVNSNEVNISIISPKLKEKLTIMSISYYSKNCYNLFLNRLLEELSSKIFASYEKYIKEIETKPEKRNIVIEKIANQFEDIKNTIANN